jgi:hypothetical protein
MKKILSAVLLTTISICALAQLPAKISIGPKLSMGFNKNIELLGFAYFIAYEGENIETKIVTVNGKDMIEKDWQKYGYQLYQNYKDYHGSPHLIGALSFTEYLWLSDIIPLLLAIDDFPKAKINADLPVKLYQSFSRTKNVEEAKKNATQFLNYCNEFYKQVDFDDYLKKSTDYYQSAAMQIKKNLPTTDFIPKMEAFYRKNFGNYQLVPSLTIPNGMGFSAKLETESTPVICNVFGAVDQQSLLTDQPINMGFGNQDKLRELSIHEFGHSFVNPYINLLPKEKLDSCAALFKPIRSRMEEEGYTTWKSCLDEHFVRAGEIIIAQLMNNQKSAKKLENEYIIDRKFVYLPIIIEELQRYQQNREDSYEKAIERVMRRLIQMD